MKINDNQSISMKIHSKSMEVLVSSNLALIRMSDRLRWYCDGTAMVLRWYCDATAMVLGWYRHGTPTVLQRLHPCLPNT